MGFLELFVVVFLFWVCRKKEVCLFVVVVGFFFLWEVVIGCCNYCSRC